MEGLVLKGIGGFYTVLDQEGQLFTLRAQGKIRHKKLVPLVGDYVRFVPGKGEEEGWLEEILPRKNSLIRPPIANIDTLCLVMAATSPEPDTLLIDKMLIICEMANIEAYVIINKCDLSKRSSEKLQAQYKTACKGVFTVEAANGIGLDALREALRGKKHAFCGQSGVGKSTLINALYGFSLEMGDISEKIERGKNTTRKCELLQLENGGMVFDTPGFSLMELPVMEPRNLLEYYPEFQGFENQCRFIPCTHRSEPGCVVKEVLPTIMDHERYERYLTIYGEEEQKWRERYD